MHLAKSVLLASSILAASTLAARAELNVVASIKPVHSLVAAVMEGVGEPGLIVEGAGSPHTYAMKPSQAEMLQSADIIFWVGRDMEAFLEKPLATAGASATSVALIEADDLVRMVFREGGAFEKHGHGDASHDDHAHEAGADHDHDHDHDHAKAADAGHDHDHVHGEFDAHIWLDPVNAKAMVYAIGEALSAADPANAAQYEANADAVMARLDALVTDVSAELEPVSDQGFVVFHDAYQYFEQRFGMLAAGSITISPEVMPGAERIAEIRERIGELGSACVFAEPQFEPKLVSTVIEGTQARAGILDPLGSSLEPGPDLYFGLIRNMAASFRTCLGAAG